MIEFKSVKKHLDEVDIVNNNYFNEINSKQKFEEKENNFKSKSVNILTTHEKMINNSDIHPHLDLSINIESKTNISSIKNNKNINDNNNNENNISYLKRSLQPSFLNFYNIDYNQNGINEIKEMNENCLICEEKLTFEELNNNFIECFHGFCDDCYYNYFKEKINNNDVENIKCPNKGCNIVLYNNFIEQKLEKDIPLLEKYIKFRERKQIMHSPDIQLCPFPDCDSYAKKIDNNMNVSCIKNGHKFCFNCLKEWHGNKSCKIDMDKSFQNWRDSKKVKRCPKCKYFIEKNEGCNHITCFNCKYEWCWLCKQKYEYGHYKFGGSCWIAIF